jgi:hypothetical protein
MSGSYVVAALRTPIGDWRGLGIAALIRLGA